VADNTAQNSFHYLPSYPPDSHHYSVVVYLRERISSLVVAAAAAKFSSHVIYGRGADSHIQVSSQPWESRWPQLGRCRGFIVNVPRTSNGLCGSYNLISAHSQQEIMTATVLHGELWLHFTNRKTDILLVHAYNMHALFGRSNYGQNCAYYNQIFTVLHILNSTNPSFLLTDSTICVNVLTDFACSIKHRKQVRNTLQYALVKSC